MMFAQYITRKITSPWGDEDGMLDNQYYAYRAFFLRREAYYLARGGEVVDAVGPLGRDQKMKSAHQGEGS
jgi:hypothetical protein